MLNVWRIFDTLTKKEMQDLQDKINKSNRKILNQQKRNRRIAAARQEEELQVNKQGDEK